MFFIFDLFSDFKTSIIRTFYIVSSQIIVFYVNLLWILPKIYENKRYALYVFLNLILIAISFYFNSFLEKFTPHYLEHNDAFHRFELNSINIENMYTNVISVILVVFVSFFLFAFQKRQQQDAKELAIISAEKTFLIQQINPHFLFNTLNNIYFLTYKKAPKGAEAIMQLSKMLDYSLHGENLESVTISDEIEYINNFISLFKLKDSSLDSIQFDYSKVDSKKRIAPLLLIPFIENAFKHGNIETSKNSFIKINLKSVENELIFQCVNTFNPNKIVDKTHGIGIKNVSRRLELLYAKNFDLQIEKEKNEFLVTLKLKLND